jgi:hypothetical protein
MPLPDMDLLCRTERIWTLTRLIRFLRRRIRPRRSIGIKSHATLTSPSPDGEVLTLAGTGTLVTDGKAHYVLTAAHVWHDVLKRAEKVGISLRADLYSQCLIERTSIVPSGPAIPNSWSEWGPDIIFLRIPEVRVGEINAFRGFYGLHCEEQSPYRGEHTQAYLVAGTPAALGTYTQNRASVQVMGFGRSSRRLTRNMRAGIILMQRLAFVLPLTPRVSGV